MSTDGAVVAGVSAVIPSYNTQGCLAQAIASVGAQTRPVEEIIVVDDGSRDGSPDLAERLGARCIRLSQNAGPAVARNVGLRAARGEYVAFLDADDYWEADHCAKAVAALERFPSAAVAFGGVRQVTRDGSPSPSARRLTPHHPTTPFEACDVFWTLVERNIVTQSAVVARRRVLLELGGYDETMRFAEDYDLWLRVAMHAHFVGVPSVTINFRVHPQQTSRAYERMVAGWWRARVRARTSAASWGPEERARLDRTLLAAWEDDLRWAWRHGDRRVFESVLAQRDAVPGAKAVGERWERRFLHLWPLWVPAVALWERLPQRTRDIIKSPARTVRAFVAGSV